MTAKTKIQGVGFLVKSVCLIAVLIMVTLCAMFVLCDALTRRLHTQAFQVKNAQRPSNHEEGETGFYYKKADATGYRHPDPNTTGYNYTYIHVDENPNHTKKNP